jgi:hypothetical protein
VLDRGNSWAQTPSSKHAAWQYRSACPLTTSLKGVDKDGLHEVEEDGIGPLFGKPVLTLKSQSRR